MRSILIGALLTCSLALASSLASAAPVPFSFTFGFTSSSGANFSGGGTLWATQNADGSYTAVSGNGTDNGAAMSLVPNPSAPGVGFFDIYSFDNQIFPGQALPLSLQGLLFQGSNLLVNMGVTGGALYYLQSAGGGSKVSAFSLDGTFTLTPEAIILPVQATGGSFAFDTAVEAGKSIFIDPEVATGYRYTTGTGDPNFASVVLPGSIGDGLYEITVGGLTFAVVGGAIFDFAAHGFAGVQEFIVTGIELSAGLDPNDPNAFLTELTFDGTGRFTGTMTAITATVPEPGGIQLAALGLVLLAIQRRRNRAGRIAR